jgi:ABC-type multidrug transport system ATPase subunit/AcrR family transcriptional regulator
MIGANGAGKTTLITMLLGLLAPSRGTVRLFGAPPTLDGRRRVGYVPQHLGLYPDLSVTENLAFRAAVFGVGRAAPHPDDRTVVGDLPLARQRIAAFRAALQHAPELLVLDEPTSGVSPLARSDLWDLVRDQAEAGVAVLVSTHYMDEAVQADRLLVMAQGRVVAAGTAAEVVGVRRTATVEVDPHPRFQHRLRPTRGARRGRRRHGPADARDPRRDDGRAQPMTAVRRPGRRPGNPEETRRAILDAARATFADAGYERATIRAIAAAADVDPALVIHHFESKQRLFVAAHELPADPEEVIHRIASLPVDARGEAITRTFLEVLAAPGSAAFSLLRAAATNEDAAAMLREFIADALLANASLVVDGDDAAFRLALVSSHLIGLVVNRTIIGVPALADRPVDDLVAAVTPSIQRYLDGP